MVLCESYRSLVGLASCRYLSRHSWALAHYHDLSTVFGRDTGARQVGLDLSQIFLGESQVLSHELFKTTIFFLDTLGERLPAGLAQTDEIMEAWLILARSVRAGHGKLNQLGSHWLRSDPGQQVI